MLLSVLVGLGGMIGWGVYDFLGGLMVKHIGPLQSSLQSQLAGLLFIIVLPLAVGPVSGASAVFLALCLLAAVAYSAGYLCFFRGFELGNISIVAATMNMWAVLTMVFTFCFMGQRLTAM